MTEFLRLEAQAVASLALLPDENRHWYLTKSRLICHNCPGKLTRYETEGKLSPLTHTIHSQIIESAMQGRPLKIPEGGDHVNDMVYNRDVANGIVMACFVENPKHRIFHLGTGKIENIRHIVEIVNNIFGKELIEIGPGLGTENPCIFDISRAQQELGYSPQYSLEEGVKDYIETMKRLDITPVVIS